MAKEEVDIQLKVETPEQIDFACDVLRTLHSVIRRMRMEQHKTWKTTDILDLLETLIFEITTGVTEEDKMRELLLVQGRVAFQANKPRSSNPYQQKQEPQNYNWWDMGWHDGEREATKAAGGAVEIHQGRIKAKPKTSKSGKYYRIQHHYKSVVTEWNETLHQYSPENNGTKFDDYEEASTIAERLKQSADGYITIITMDAN
ncbi:hypothetical protein [Candidatus Venteria ishoeyi]|uniref:Uncharacterized protein n=1 Tax=Candidatus Venteria ishoeyi TaxID=1899563 RepID=A0A1H6F9M2_9GAMM|nr:hypothetical protein [Candidatus Venteria ishoeyi]MDM8547145.1 hypothetical protein [Candidatus Venteria ishoeyi]SEH06792.1 Uncharacterised protein [Candidatus Venteria ishoeyi]